MVDCLGVLWYLRTGAEYSGGAMSDISDIYTSLNKLGDIAYQLQQTINELQAELREKNERIRVLEKAVKGR